MHSAPLDAPQRLTLRPNNRPKTAAAIVAYDFRKRRWRPTASSGPSWRVAEWRWLRNGAPPDGSNLTLRYRSGRSPAEGEGVKSTQTHLQVLRRAASLRLDSSQRIASGSGGFCVMLSDARRARHERDAQLVEQAQARANRRIVRGERYRLRCAAGIERSRPRKARTVAGYSQTVVESARGARRPSGQIEVARVRRAGRGGATPSHGAILRYGRLHGALRRARPRTVRRFAQTLSERRRGSDRAIRWFRRQIHGRRHFGLLRLSARL